MYQRCLEFTQAIIDSIRERILADIPDLITLHRQIAEMRGTHPEDPIDYIEECVRSKEERVEHLFGLDRFSTHTKTATSTIATIGDQLETDLKLIYLEADRNPYFHNHSAIRNRVFQICCGDLKLYMIICPEAGLNHFEMQAKSTLDAAKELARDK
jgi:hypothetical protein